MIPPHIYHRQMSYRTPTGFFSFFSPNNNLEFVLEADGLRIQTAIKNRFTFLKYSDMNTIRLDYDRSGGGKNRRKKKKFYCYINEEITINTAWLSRSMWSDEEDTNYNNFVLELHTKLHQLPNLACTFHTGLTEGNYEMLLVVLGMVGVIMAFIVGFMLLNGSNFDIFFLFFIAIFASVCFSAFTDNKPSAYSAMLVPANFLS